MVNIVNSYNLTDFTVRCVKWGRWDGEKLDPEKQNIQVESLTDVKEVLSFPYLIVGATGYGLHDLMAKQNSGSAGGNHGTNNNSGKPFDWIIFDEASHMLIPQALLSLIYGKSNFLFLGDVKQLPPLIRSSVFKETPAKTEADKDSINAEIRARKKLIVVGSKIFFEAIARTEKQLQANACFKISSNTVAKPMHILNTILITVNANAGFARNLRHKGTEAEGTKLFLLQEFLKTGIFVEDHFVFFSKS